MDKQGRANTMSLYKKNKDFHLYIIESIDRLIMGHL